jgi:hypothetical protein
MSNKPCPLHDQSRKRPCKQAKNPLDICQHFQPTRSRCAHTPPSLSPTCTHRSPRHVGGLGPVGLLRDWDLGAVSLCRCAVPSRLGRRAVVCVCRCTCVRSLTLESRVHEHSRRVLVCALSSGAERAGTRGAAACPHAWGGLCVGCRVVGESPM